MSHREFMLTVEGYKERKIEEYRKTRMLMFTMVRLWSEKGPRTPEQLWPLPGDEEKGVLDEEDKKALLERFAKLRNG